MTELVFPPRSLRPALDKALIFWQTNMWWVPVAQLEFTVCSPAALSGAKAPFWCPVIRLGTGNIIELRSWAFHANAEVAWFGLGIAIGFYIPFTSPIRKNHD